MVALATPVPTVPSAAVADTMWPSGIVAVAGGGMYWMNPDGTGMHTVRSMPTKITEGLYGATDGVVSPLGNRVAYVFGNLEDVYAGPLVVANLDGTGWRTLVSSGVTRPSWSPDGKRIVFNGFNSAGKRVLKVVNVTGTPVVTIVPGSVGLRDAAYNPRDGAELVATRPGANHLVVTPIEILKAGVANAVPGVTGGTPSMSTDGRIVYVSEANRSGHFEPAGIAVANRDGTGQRALTSPNADAMEYDRNPAWSPDASLVYFSRSVNEAPCQLFAIRSDGSAAQVLVRSLGFTFRTPIRTSFAPRDVTPPPAVTGLALRLNAARHPVLTWTNSTAVDFSHVVITRTSSAGTAKVYTGRGTSFTDLKVSIFAATRTYTYAVTAVDGIGNSSTATSARTRAAMGALRVPAVASSGSASSQFRISWAPVNPVNPAGTRYRIWWHRHTATTQNAWRLWTSTTSTSTIFGRNGSPTVLLAGATYYFRVRAVDGFGRVSAPAFANVTVPYDDPAARYAGFWTARHGVAGQWLGTVHSTDQAGAAMRLTRVGMRYYVIGERTPLTGAFAVYLGSVYQGTVDTRSSTALVRRVLWASAPMPNERRTLTVVNLATPGHPQLRIDAVAVQH